MDPMEMEDGKMKSLNEFMEKIAGPNDPHGTQQPNGPWSSGAPLPGQPFLQSGNVNRGYSSNGYSRPGISASHAPGNYSYFNQRPQPRYYPQRPQAPVAPAPSPPNNRQGLTERQRRLINEARARRRMIGEGTFKLDNPVDFYETSRSTNNPIQPDISAQGTKPAAPVKTDAKAPQKTEAPQPPQKIPVPPTRPVKRVRDERLLSNILTNRDVGFKARFGRKGTGYYRNSTYSLSPRKHSPQNEAINLPQNEAINRRPNSLGASLDHANKRMKILENQLILHPNSPDLKIRYNIAKRRHEHLMAMSRDKDLPVATATDIVSGAKYLDAKKRRALANIIKLTGKKITSRRIEDIVDKYNKSGGEESLIDTNTGIKAYIDDQMSKMTNNNSTSRQKAILRRKIERNINRRFKEPMDIKRKAIIKRDDEEYAAKMKDYNRATSNDATQVASSPTQNEKQPVNAKA